MGPLTGPPLLEHTPPTQVSYLCLGSIKVGWEVCWARVRYSGAWVRVVLGGSRRSGWAYVDDGV
jgi:hypothetical protein